MTSKLSRAKALKAFIDKLSFPKSPPNNTMIQVIADSFKMKPESPEFRKLLHTQIENFDVLLEEIRLARMGNELKEVAIKRIHALSRFLLHPTLYSHAEKVRAEVIKPNADQLYVVSDVLDMFTDWSEQTKASIEEAVQHLQEAYDSIDKSDVDQKIKAAVLPSLNALISLLRNYEVVGFERAWEMTNNTIAVIQRQLGHATTESDKDKLMSLGKGVLRVAAFITSLDSAYKSVVSLGAGGIAIYKYLKGNTSGGVPELLDESGKSDSTDITSI